MNTSEKLLAYPVSRASRAFETGVFFTVNKPVFCLTHPAIMPNMMKRARNVDQRCSGVNNGAVWFQTERRTPAADLESTPAAGLLMSEDRAREDT